MNGNSLSPHYATAQGHQATNVNSNNAYQVTSNWDAQAPNTVQQTESLKTSSQHSAVANAAAGYFSRHTGNGLGNNQVMSQRLSGISSGSSDNQLTNGSNPYANGPHSQPNYANPSLYYGSPSSQPQSFSPLSKSPSSVMNRSTNRSALQQQLTNSNPQYVPGVTAGNSTTSPSLNLSHRSKSVDLLNSNENSDNSSHSTSSQQNKMNNAQSPLNSLLNSSNNSNLKTNHQPEAYFNSPAPSTQLQQGGTINSYYGRF